MKDLTFHLIKEKLVKDNNLKLEQGDVTEIAKQAARAQFAQYGMMSLPDEMVENYAQEMLKDQNTARNLVDRAMENKLVVVLKEALGVEEKVVSVEDFRKLFEGEAAEA